MPLPPTWRVTLLAATLLAVTLAWAWPQDLGAWRSLGLLSGWAGLALLATSVLLLLREARTARALGGLQAMLRGHHLTGTLGYALLLLHPLALALDAAGGEAAIDATQAWALLNPADTSVALGLGWAALLALMAGLATTFTLHLRYRRWRGWHHLLAAAMVLALLHVQQLYADPWVLGLLAAVSALALLLRYGAVDRGRLSLPYTVAAVHRAAPQVVEITLQPQAGAMQVQPGQFVVLSFGDGPGFHGNHECHPFTASGVGPGGRLQVAIKALGPCSTQVQQVQPGTTVRVQGPFGDFLPGVQDGPQLWVAGGIGVSPFVAALRAGPLTQPTTLLVLLRDARADAFADELQQLARQQPRLTLVLRSSRDAGVDLPPLLDAVPGLAQRQVLACGPGPLLQVLAAALAQRGVPAAALHAESFDFR